MLLTSVIPSATRTTFFAGGITSDWMTRFAAAPAPSAPTPTQMRITELWEFHVVAARSARNSPKTPSIVKPTQAISARLVLSVNMRRRHSTEIGPSASGSQRYLITSTPPFHQRAFR